MYYHAVTNLDTVDVWKDTLSKTNMFTQQTVL